MNEKTPGGNFEKSPIPNEREVLNLMEGLIGEKTYTEVIRREDEEGLYRLLIEVIGDDGDPVRYDFIRAGQFPEGNTSETAIDIIYLDNEGNEVGGKKAASFVNGTWIMD
jgi:hypothetical protein